MKLARSSLSLVVSRANSESMNLRVRAPGFVSSSVVFRRCVRTSCGSSSDCGGRGERLLVDVRITPRDDEITRTELFIEIPISNYHRHLGAVEFLRSFSPPTSETSKALLTQQFLHAVPPAWILSQLHQKFQQVLHQRVFPSLANTQRKRRLIILSTGESRGGK